MLNSITANREETHLNATINKIALSKRIPLPPEPAGPIQQMTASSPAILINHYPDSINESGVTSTRCNPNCQDYRSRRNGMEIRIFGCQRRRRLYPV
ncbi:hypothetical protein TNCV_4492761 [Trichonephila clavipes]|uniref:Uncharacterized protein n=1 Tax=Trichonephila clavipes TaxID=2585209 RepID=A0A8X6VNJ4_TRICX|nr:hypothetical protein TNCV_4492761 [Trichonephila clavipes]